MRESCALIGWGFWRFRAHRAPRGHSKGIPGRIKILKILKRLKILPKERYSEICKDTIVDWKQLRRGSQPGTLLTQPLPGVANTTRAFGKSATMTAAPSDRERSRPMLQNPEAKNSMIGCKCPDTCSLNCISIQNIFFRPQLGSTFPHQVVGYKTIASTSISRRNASKVYFCTKYPVK